MTATRPSAGRSKGSWRRDDCWMTPGGASVLLPNGPAIQSMLQQALSPAPRTTDVEPLTVEVRNGTFNPGWDSLAA